jgi:hypothetical protein
MARRASEARFTRHSGDDASAEVGVDSRDHQVDDRGERVHTANHQSGGRMAESRSRLMARIAEIRDDAEQVDAICTHRSTKTLIERVRLELSEIERLYLSGPPPPLAEARLLVAVGPWWTSKR